MNLFRYTAREFDTETGLYFYRSRYYDSSAGKFISEDPARFAEGQNFYAYVANDVTRFRDPLGLSPLPYANSVSECDKQFQECKHKAQMAFLKGGFIVFAASQIAFDTVTAGCIGLTGPALVACILAVEDVNTAVTPVLIAPFGGDYFGSLADCWNQKAACLAKQVCKP
jgi:RHS repeat-associated protein